jgi:hypothetical protein
MNRFWTREARLARRLKAERPQPSRHFMSSLMERFDAVEAPRTRRNFGLRVGLASAVSLAFLTGIAAFGGLGYAATSLEHVGRTASHVVIPQRHATSTQARGNTSTGEQSSKSHGVSSADDQYNNEIVCVLVFPGTKYAHILRLPRFLVPFYLALNPNAVVVTCPVRRHRD